MYWSLGLIVIGAALSASAGFIGERKNLVARLALGGALVSLAGGAVGQLQQAAYERTVTARLEEAVGELTGGDSELLLLARVEHGEVIVIAQVMGSFPMQEVYVVGGTFAGEHRVRSKDKGNARGLDSRQLMLGAMYPHIWQEVGRWKLPDPNVARLGFNSFSRAGNWGTSMTGHRVGDEWSFAYHRTFMKRVPMPKGVKVPEDMVPEDFPRAPDGTPLW